MDEFCGSKFWDWNATWNTDSPHFTPCFEETVLVWIPCVYFWFFFFVGYHQCRTSGYREIPYGWLNVTKLIGVSLLFLITLADTLYAAFFHPPGMKMYPVDYMTGVIKHITFALVATLIALFRKNGIRTSYVSLSFWLFLVIFSVPHYITEISSITNPSQKNDVRLYPYISNVIYFPTLFAMLLLEMFVDARPLVWLRPPLQPPPVVSDISYLNAFLAVWFDKFAINNYRGKLTMEDLPGIDYQERLQYLAPVFTKNWNIVKSKNEKKDATRGGYQNMDVPYSKLRSSKDVSVIAVLWRCVRRSFLIATFFKIVSDVLMFISPQILRLIINYLQNDEPVWRGYFYTFAMTFICCTQSFMSNNYLFNASKIGLETRNTLINVVFSKVLRISNGAKKMFTAGEIANLMSVDAQRFVDIFIYCNMAVAAPTTVFAALYFMWQLIGASALTGLILLLLIVPINMLGGRRMKKLQLRQMKLKDERVKITNEVLSGIRVLKMYAWEPSFSEKILQIRAQEIRLLKKIAYTDTVISFTWMTAPIMISMIVFATFTLSDERNVLTTEIALVSLSLFNIMRTPISLIPRFVSNLTQAAVAAKRLTRFLNAEELDTCVVSHKNTGDIHVTVDRCKFSWEEDEPPILKDINLEIKKGSLVAIVGPVGSGKSSLLSAILGEMYNVGGGRVNINGSVAYVPQQAWIQNATLRDNVLFMKPYQATKYNKVIDACALIPDLQVLLSGDSTEIGEKGINLSGGQKQRISLARAVYNDAEIYFLDDPMSAVDAHVGKDIFQNVIGPHGLLKNKTRLLVTNAITYLPEMDFIAVMKNGVIVEYGTYNELLSNEGEFANFVANYTLDEKTEELKETVSSVQRVTPTDDIGVLSSLPDELTDNTVVQSMSDKLIAKEQTKVGKVKWEVYWYYIKAGGGLLWLGNITFNVLYQALSVLANLWLTYWSGDPAGMTKKYYYLGGYMAFVIGIAISTILASLTMNFAVVNAAARLHENLLQKVMCWRAYVFDITPIGQILNRFSYDIDVVDNSISLSMKQMATVGGTVMATMCVILFSSPIFIVALIPLVILYVFLEQLYVGMTRQLKRLESASRSPVYSYFSETITGAPVIRAYQMEKKFMVESDERLLKNQIAAYASLWAFKWILIRLDSFANLIIMLVSLLAVLYRGMRNSGVLSLSITYALQLTRSMTWVVRAASDIESNVVSIERIKEFERTAVEQVDSPKYRNIPLSWPDKGVIVFEGYKARYRAELDFVLNDVNIRIESGEKVGVIGRTGAGKSSLSLSLFRIFEPAEGRIIIDGIDITEIRLNVLRSRITIIPQDPVLFSGTIRVNLDPFFEYSDQQLWKTLELAHLKKFVVSLPEGLSHEITENGGNLSIGQRQLICLARALLRKTQILVLDEATAAIDLETDELIQKTIRKEFAECTVLTIAHKLNTVLDSDRIMVLDRGQVKEFDSPARLLEAKNSIFYGMAKEAGLVL